jgi:MFS family permease
VGSFSLVKEPPEAVDPRRLGLREQLQHARQLLVRDRNYGRFLVLTVCIVLTTYSAPFYAVYARRELHAVEGMVGTYVLGLTLATVVANLALGPVGDRRGSRLLVRVAALTSMLPALTALLVKRLPGIGLDSQMVFTVVFLFQGIHTTAGILGNNNYMLELSPSIERVLYISLTNGIVGLAWFALPLGGVVVDRFGFDALFTVSLAAGLVATLLSLSLKEPRAHMPAKAEAIADVA